MPLTSKYALKVFVPDDATEQQYANFEQSFSAPQEGRKRPALLSFGSDHQKKTKPFETSAAHSPRVSSPDDNDDYIPSLSSANDRIRPSITSQHGLRVGTMVFQSKTASTAVLEQHEKKKLDAGYQWKDWDLSSDFQGITVLYEHKGEGDSIKMDICAVHGLGGNAMDTWAVSEKGLMWLRDCLPYSDYFTNSRIMTFGYDSDLTDRSTVANLENWADYLLHCLDEVRTSEEEKARPILFVCHSLGGLVARSAMSQLPTSDITGITLSQCGLIFLATPHSGTVKADWNNFVVAVAETVTGLRSEVLRTLRAFDPASVWDKKAFLKLSPRPPFRCFAEGKKKRIKGTYQYIVTQASASLDPENPAVMIPRDHSGICKFDTKSAPYNTISLALQRVFLEVTKRLEAEQAQEQRVR